MNTRQLLKDFGLSDKEISVYLALVALGPSPVRLVGEKAEINRGTTYDILRSLQDLGLVSFFDKEAKQYFMAEDPEKLITALDERKKNIDKVKSELNEHLPELRALFQISGDKPRVSLYEGMDGVRQILEDVLDVMDEVNPSEYYVYSSAGLRGNVYEAMPDFSNRRIKRGISVKTLALGNGGQTVGLDERKWLPTGGKEFKSTYEIIYGNRVAHISLDVGQNPVGVIIQNSGIYETQKFIFNSLWEKI